MRSQCAKVMLFTSNYTGRIVGFFSHAEAFCCSPVSQGKPNAVKDTFSGADCPEMFPTFSEMHKI